LIFQTNLQIYKHIYCHWINRHRKSLCKVLFKSKTKSEAGSNENQFHTLSGSELPVNQSCKDRVLKQIYKRAGLSRPVLCQSWRYTGLPDFYRYMILKLWKCTKGTKNVLNGHKISQMFVKCYEWCIHISTFSNLKPSKIYPNWDFWFEKKPSGNPGGIAIDSRWPGWSSFVPMSDCLLLVCMGRF
jgi:hypothetical protein